MYHAIVRARVRSLWRRIDAGDHLAAVATAAPDLRFRFAGDTPVSASFTGRDAFEQWFRAFYERFPGIRLTPREVIVRGWPWRTTVVVRLDVAATLADGTPYRNEAVQWLTLRWGRMVADEVLEDTKALDEACRRQAAAVAADR
ncbi:nuclear transport factor 2 family protein [Kitasatospora phosalacinea]|uniref:nuclear transport factor 2 family protein n=1 Tax=Kitasatospora phosalacinea TaxID=2065 RepID=UPI0006911F2E|nr:nuclear transport factor 2 family protein [Kitasatospora phosalacinea]